MSPLVFHQHTCLSITSALSAMTDVTNAIVSQNAQNARVDISFITITVFNSALLDIMLLMECACSVITDVNNVMQIIVLVVWLVLMRVLMVDAIPNVNQEHSTINPHSRVKYVQVSANNVMDL